MLVLTEDDNEPISEDLSSEEDSIETPVIVKDQTLSWEEMVLSAARYACGNCGGEDRVDAYLVVPEEAGGKKTPSNGVALCRPCEMARESARSGKPGGRRLVNFWVGKDLATWLSGGADSTGFSSTSALVRALMSRYVRKPSLYEDIANYQEEGGDAKVNVWVDAALYPTFKELTAANGGLTVTAALKGLLLSYRAEAERAAAARA